MLKMGRKSCIRPQSMWTYLLTLALTCIIMTLLLRGPDSSDPVTQPYLVSRDLMPRVLRTTYNSSLIALDLRPRHDLAPAIPHVIHQVWAEGAVPDRYRNWTQRWRSLHPGWQYRAWSHEDVRTLIGKHFPASLLVFDGYPSDAHRVQAARYFILYHHGGIFADADTEPLRSLDNWTYNYKCVFSQDSEQHMYIIRRQSAPNIVNTILLCRPQHPIFKRAIEMLTTHAHDAHPDDVASAAGHVVMQAAFVQYGNRSTHAQGWKPGSDVTVVPARYLQPTFSVLEMGLLINKCGETHAWQLVPRAQVLCHELRRTYFRLVVPPEAFTRYHWSRGQDVGKILKPLNISGPKDNEGTLVRFAHQASNSHMPSEI